MYWTSKPVAALLLASSIQATATPSPNKASFGSGVFPKYKSLSATFATDMPADNYTSNQVTEKFAKNDAGAYYTGTYASFRVGLTVAPTQEIAKKGSTDGQACPEITGLAKAKQKTFYETNKDNLGTYTGVGVAAALDGSNAKAAKAALLTYGPVYTAWAKDDLKALSSTANSFKSAYSVVMQFASVDTGTAYKVCAVKNRIMFDAAQTYPNASDSDATKQGAIENCGDTTNKNCYYTKMNEDFILGTFYQSNGTATDGSTWCSGSLLTEVAVSASTAQWNANQGFGPKGKCTWQMVAAANTHGPAFTVKTLPSLAITVQVIEWYATAQLTTTTLIDATKAAATPGFLIKDTATYAAAEGVFFNPVETVITSLAATAPAMPTGNAFAMNAVYASDNTMAQIPNSIGTALYHEDDAGQSKDTVQSVDSTWFMNAYGVYNEVVKGYNSLKTTYDTDKTAYETAVEDRKKDPKKTLPTRPNMPSVPSAYSGPKLLLSGQTANPVVDWGTTILKESGINGVLGTQMSGSTLKYDQADLAKTFSNRLRYVTLAADTTGVTGAPAAAKFEGASATFGRLGAGISTQLDNAVPFKWQVAVSGAKPGMQVSLFPEFVTGATGVTGWNNWGTGTTARAVIDYGVKTFGADADFQAPSQPAAATAIADGANKMLVSSVLALSLVAATLV